MRRTDFETHGLWQTLQACETTLTDSVEWLSEEAAPDIGQVRWVVATLRSHDDPSDTAPYARSVLDAIQNSLGQVGGAIDQVKANESGTFLANAAPYIDQLTQQVATLPPVTNRDPARTAGRTFVDYREAVEASLEALRRENADLAAKVEERSAAGTALETSHAAEVSRLTSEVAALEERITTDEERLRKELTNTNEAFNAKQTEREERFNEWLDEQATALDGRALADLTQIVKLKADATAHLAEIRELHDSVEKTSSKAAGAILAKDYGSYSTREWVSGVIAYVLGFALLVVLAVYLIHTVAGVSKDEDVSWQYVALKLGLSITAIAASGVAFQFGSHALGRANTNKRVQLELGTIGTFLADVEDENAVKQAKVDFVTRMFGRAWDEKGVASPSDKAVDQSTVAKLVDTVQRLVK